MLNLMDVSAGQYLRLRSGSLYQVTENMGDGIWVQVRAVGNEAGPGSDGTEELVHCEEVAGLAGDSR